MPKHETNTMQLNTKANKSKVIFGTLFVNSILITSLAVSISYWFVLSGLNESSAPSSLMTVTLYSIIALGICAELTKKVAISLFQHKGLWIAATIVSVITIMGSLAITESNKQAGLIKASDQYQSSQLRSKEALDTASKYAFAANYDLPALEQNLEQLTKLRSDRRIKYAPYLQKKNALTEKIKAARSYEAALAMNAVSTATMATGGSAGNNTSANPLLANMATSLNIKAALVINVFYLAVTILLEYAALFVGIQVQKLKDEANLNAQELLELQNMNMFGYTVAQLSHQHSPRIGMNDNVSQSIDSIGSSPQVSNLQSTSNTPSASTEQAFMGFVSTDTRPKSKATVGTLSVAPDTSVITEHPTEQTNQPSVITDQQILRMKQLHAYAKSVPNGETIQCPVCEQASTKRRNAIFCGNKGKGNHADEYHNIITPTRVEALINKQRKHKA